MTKDKLTLSFIPYSEIQELSSVKRINKVLDIILKNRIVILQGRLASTEEASLIQSTMALVGRVKGFKGVELAVIAGNQDTVGARLRHNLAKMLVGDSNALTIIGPAAMVKEIKRDPSKIELMLKK